MKTRLLGSGVTHWVQCFGRPVLGVSQKGGTLGIYRDYMGIMGVLIRDCIGIILINTLLRIEERA